MADLNVITINDEEVLQYAHTTDAAGKHSVTLNTKNTFVDKNINIDINTPAAADPALDITDLTANMDMGTAVDGYYNPEVNVAGKVAVATAGWITAGDHTVSENGVKVGKVAQSTLKNGATAINSGAQIIPEVSNDQTINITEGYEAARTVVVKSMEAGQKAEVSSSNVAIATADTTIAFDSTSEKFKATATKEIAAPAVNTPGFISSTLGTKNAGEATVNTEMDQVQVGVTITGTPKVTPVIARTAKAGSDTWVDAASGAATTTKPVAGAYVQVDAAAVTGSLSAVGKVTGEGYGTSEHYVADTATATEIGTNAADTAYVPIKEGAVESATAEIATVAHSYNATSGKFDITGAANIPAPTVTEGYIGAGVGTATGATNGATVAAEVNKIAIAATLTGTGTAKPVIAKEAVTNVDSGAATTTQPASGFYVAVKTAADTQNVKATAAVTAAGYGDTTEGHYTTVDSSDLEVGAEASDMTYVPISAASFANASASGETYSDISSTGPVLISGDYLYINKGYTDNVKISLARLVPDAASQNLAADMILANYSAYNNDGALITGTIPTYDGSYTVA